MAESILYGLAQEVVKNLGSAALNEIASAWGFKTQLQKLQNTINTLKDVLLDAEDKQADNHAARRWLERLSTVVYAADDLFDEFNAVAARKQLNGGHKLTKKVCTFFSHSNQVVFACKISELWITFPSPYGVCDGEAADCKHDEAVLEGLEPPPEIKSLSIDYYRGENVPSWASMVNLCTTLPNLVKITLWGWTRCQQLPAFSQLPFLKRLELENVESVEYIESEDVRGVHSSSIFFPSLEQLGLKYMKNLRLLPVCPNVEDLSLRRTNETLSVLKMATTSTCSSSTSSVPSSSSTGSGLKLKKLEIDNAEDLLSLPNHCLLHLSYLRVDGDKKLESTERLGNVFTTLSSSFRSLEFWDCQKLRSIAKGLEHLTNLESLELKECNLNLWGDEEEGMPWKALNTTLRSLTLEYLRQLVGLPTGLQHLSNLRSLSLILNTGLEELPEWMNCLSSLEYLKLEFCPKLKCLPEAFRQLTTLNHLEIIQCEGLTARCQEGPNGSDWPKIQHISLISVRDQP